jgi:hypothetical protein
VDGAKLQSAALLQRIEGNGQQVVVGIDLHSDRR